MASGGTRGPFLFPALTQIQTAPLTTGGRRPGPDGIAQSWSAPLTTGLHPAQLDGAARDRAAPPKAVPRRSSPDAETRNRFPPFVAIRYRIPAKWRNPANGWFLRENGGASPQPGSTGQETLVAKPAPTKEFRRRLSRRCTRAPVGSLPEAAGTCRNAPEADGRPTGRTAVTRFRDLFAKQS